MAADISTKNFILNEYDTSGKASLEYFTKQEKNANIACI